MKAGKSGSALKAANPWRASDAVPSRRYPPDSESKRLRSRAIGLYLEEACIPSGENERGDKSELIVKNQLRQRGFTLRCPLAPDLLLAVHSRVRIFKAGWTSITLFLFEDLSAHPGA